MAVIKVAMIGRVAPNGKTYIIPNPSAIGTVMIGVNLPIVIAEYSMELANPLSAGVDTSATKRELRGESMPWENPDKHAVMARK